jgi:hypothetical protein
MKTLDEPLVLYFETYDEADTGIDGARCVFKSLGVEYGEITTETTHIGVRVTFHPPAATPTYDPDDPFAAAFLRR